MGGGHTRWVERGWVVNSSEDARHYCSVLYVSTLWAGHSRILLEHETTRWGGKVVGYEENGAPITWLASQPHHPASRYDLWFCCYGVGAHPLSLNFSCVTPIAVWAAQKIRHNCLQDNGIFSKMDGMS